MSLKRNIKLPEKYKNFILLSNGGFPEEDVLINQGEDVLELFYSIKYGTQLVEDRIETFQVVEDLIPKNHLPVAAGNNSVYTLSLDASSEGSVHGWYFDLGETQTKKIANDLEEFLGGWIE